METVYHGLGRFPLAPGEERYQYWLGSLAGGTGHGVHIVERFAVTGGAEGDGLIDRFGIDDGADAVVKKRRLER